MSRALLLLQYVTACVAAKGCFPADELLRNATDWTKHHLSRDDASKPNVVARLVRYTGLSVGSKQLDALGSDKRYSLLQTYNLTLPQGPRPGPRARGGLTGAPFPKTQERLSQLFLYPSALYF